MTVEIIVDSALKPLRLLLAARKHLKTAMKSMIERSKQLLGQCSSYVICPHHIFEEFETGVDENHIPTISLVSHGH
jgi:hypothetical protein